MITAIVEYRLPSPLSAAEMQSRFRHVEPMFRGLAGLQRKSFCYDAGSGEGVSVYVWSGREAAERCYAPEFFAGFEQVFGTRPTVRYLPVLMVIDNVANDVAYPAL